MSVQIANVSLSAAVVGTTGSIDLGAIPPPTIGAQMNPKQMLAATLLIFNESACGLTASFPVSGETFTIAAGHWKQVTVPPNETTLKYDVIYVLPNPFVSKLLVDLYLPGEAMDSIGSLGNSPASVGSTYGSSQFRNISVPLAPITLTNRGVTLTAGSDIVLRTDTFPGGAPPGGATPVVYVYCYYLYFSLSTPGGNGNQFADMTFYADLMNGATLVASRLLDQFFVTSINQSVGISIVPHAFAPAYPASNFFAGFGLPLSGVRWRFHVENAGGGVAPISAWWNVGVGVDLANSVGPGTHGNFAPNVGVF